MTRFDLVCQRLLVWLLLVGVPYQSATAQNEAPQPEDGQMTRLKVVLTDPEGAPVAGAEVMPYAMRMKEQPGHGYWDRKTFGPPRTFISNEQGEALIEYPAYVKAGPRRLTTTLVSFQVQHTDYVQQTIHFNLGPDQAKVALKPGCEVQITAVNEKTRQPINDFGVVMAGPHGIAMWELAEGGGRRTSSIDDGTWQTLLVKEQADGPTLFSRVMPARLRPQQALVLRNVWMEPGAVVRGKISKDVPRPVKGYVVATSAPSPAGDAWGEEDPSLLWHDWVNVQPDGTFRFESLPHGGEVQLIAICDGWISSTTVPDARNFVMGELFDVDAETVDVELQMEPTGTLEVEVTAPDGTPVKDGTISSWPNQSYYKGGSTMLGQRFRSLDRVRNQLLPPDRRKEWYSEEFAVRYQSKLNNGKAVLTGIPVGHSEGLYLSHQELVLKTDAGDPFAQGSIRFELPSTEPVTLKLETTRVKE